MALKTSLKLGRINNRTSKRVRKCVESIWYFERYRFKNKENVICWKTRTWYLDANNHMAIYSTQYGTKQQRGHVDVERSRESFREQGGAWGAKKPGDASSLAVSKKAEKGGFIHSHLTTFTHIIHRCTHPYIFANKHTHENKHTQTNTHDGCVYEWTSLSLPRLRVSFPGAATWHSRWHIYPKSHILCLMVPPS